MPDPSVVVVAVAALWGAAAGVLLPRAVYRFSVPSGEAWRTLCPGGHPLRGWLGRARCGQCGERAAPGAHGSGAAQVPEPPSRAGAHGPGGAQGPGDAQSPGVTSDPGGTWDPGGAPDPGRAPDAGGAYGPGGGVLAVVTGLVCAVLGAATGTRPELAVWLLLAPVGVLLAVVDLRVKRLPDPLTLPLAGAALALLGLAALAPEHAGQWTTALLGALALGAGYFVLFLISPGSMGFGDVKLALGAGAVLGWYGWPTVVLGTFAGFLLGALYGGALVVARRAGRRTAIPFGPFLIGGAYLGLLAGAYGA